MVPGGHLLGKHGQVTRLGAEVLAKQRPKCGLLARLGLERGPNELAKQLTELLELLLHREDTTSIKEG